MTDRLTIWIAFLLTVAVAAVIHWFGSATSDGGGPCAIMGFGLLLVLLAGTAIESLTSRRRRTRGRPRGFGVTPTTDPRGTDAPPAIGRRAPAKVLGCLRDGAIRVVLHPNVGLADGGFHGDVPSDLVPLDLRMPNSEVWVHFDENGNAKSVSRRAE